MTLLTRREALDLLLSKASIIEGCETLETEKALGRILAGDLLSPLDVPAFDNSAMDGFALSSRGPDLLAISQRIPAGTSPLPLEAGTAARIFTGAMVPEGADAVVMQEDCTHDGKTVRVARMPRTGENIRRRGEDLSRGGVFLEKGRKLRPQELGLIASVGISSVEVYRKLKVAVFFTGSELVMPGNPLETGKIYNSNRYSLVSLLESLNCETVDLGIVHDDPQETLAMLEAARSRADIVMTCGGVSVGEEDHVRGAVEKLGRLSLWKVAVKPGKPFAFGDLGGTPFIGLPGNPVSSFLVFCFFARPYLLACQGASVHEPLSLPVKADFEWKGGNRTEWLRARLTDSGAAICPNQGSASFASLSWAEGIVEIPQGKSVSRGEEVRFVSFGELFN